MKSKCINLIIAYLSYLDNCKKTYEFLNERNIAIMIKDKINMDDGFNAELVETAFFDGIFEIPIIDPPPKLVIPE